MVTEHAYYGRHGSRTLGTRSSRRMGSPHAPRRRDGAVWVARLLEMALPPDHFAPPAIAGRTLVRGIAGSIPSACSHSLPKANRRRAPCGPADALQSHYCDLRSRLLSARPKIRLG